MSEQLAIAVIGQALLLIGGIITVLRRIDRNHAQSENNQTKAISKFELLDNNVKSMNIFMQKQIQDIDEKVTAINKKLEHQSERLYNVEIKQAKYEGAK